MTAIAIRYRAEIIRQVSTGELLLHIAEKLGCSPAAISQQLAKDPEYRQARETGAELRLEKQYQALVEADDHLKVARAREAFRAAAWFAEREFPERWAGKGLQVVVSQAIDPEDRIEAARRIAFVLAEGAHLAEQRKREPRLLEGEVVDKPVDKVLAESPPKRNLPHNTRRTPTTS